jgi:hypothetical protein
MRVWRTNDQAAHWTEVVNHPVVNTSGASGSQRPLDCHVAADLFDPSTAALVYFEDVVQPVPGTKVFKEDYVSSLSITHDAGKTWRTLSPPAFLGQQTATVGTCDVGCDLRRLATTGGKTYTLFSNFHTPQYRQYAAIGVSADGMRTWAPAGPPASQLYGMWVNRATGALLVASERGFGRSDYVVDTLWASSDGQAPWRNVQDFTGEVVFNLVANTPRANEPWKLCYSLSDFPSNSPNANATTPATTPVASGTYCSDDSGATWRRAGPLEYADLVLAQDGSVYGITAGCAVLRLRQDVATWEPVGMLPATGVCAPYTFVVNAGVEYPGEAGHVVFWSIPIVGYGAPTASSPAVYTADYA